MLQLTETESAHGPMTMDLCGCMENLKISKIDSKCVDDGVMNRNYYKHSTNVVW